MKGIPFHSLAEYCLPFFLRQLCRLGDQEDIHVPRPLHECAVGLGRLPVQLCGNQHFFRVRTAKTCGNGMKLIQPLVTDISVFAGDEYRTMPLHQKYIDFI